MVPIPAAMSVAAIEVRDTPIASECAIAARYPRSAEALAAKASSSKARTGAERPGCKIPASHMAAEVATAEMSSAATKVTAPSAVAASPRIGNGTPEREEQNRPQRRDNFRTH